MINTKPYEELKDRQREEFNNFPIAYAFNKQQLQEALDKLGAESIMECVSVFGHGDIVKKENAMKLVEMMKRHDQEVAEAMKDYDFAVGAFLYEMNNHEYCINWEGDENVLGCFMLDFEKLEKLGLSGAYRTARQEHMRIAREEWEVI